MSATAILGLGLIGGSLARSLAEQGERILGYDRSPDTIAASVKSGVVTTELGRDLEGLEDATTVILAVPVQDARELLERIRPRLRNAELITDVGSTKRSICAAAQAFGLADRFVGAHPYAGDHRSGWEASRPDLFHGTRVFLCQLDETSQEALNQARSLWTRVGATTQWIDPAEHDRRLAWTSHLPQFASTSIALALTARGLGLDELGSGGRDVTRLAGSNPELWRGIARDNADNLLEALDGVLHELAALRAAVAGGDDTSLGMRFERAAAWSLNIR